MKSLLKYLKLKIFEKPILAKIDFINKKVMKITMLNILLLCEIIVFLNLIYLISILQLLTYLLVFVQ